MLILAVTITMSLWWLSFAIFTIIGIGGCIYSATHESHSGYLGSMPDLGGCLIAAAAFLILIGMVVGKIL